MKKTNPKSLFKSIAGIIAALMLFSFPAVVQAEDGGLYMLSEEVPLQAPGAIVVSADSGLVVYERNADQQFICASLVKMMTCILAVENVADLDAPTMEARGWIYDALYGKNASHADIRKGEVLTMRELLYAMLLPSANEAALITADYISGQYYKNFIYMMNRKAEALGCTGTVFVDPNGLSQENLSTPRDMYLIIREFMSHPVLAEIAGTSIYEMPAHNHEAPYNILTTNRLLVASDPYANAYPKTKGTIVGGKTGSLGEWQNFASLAKKDDEAYYCVVMNSPNEADTVAGEGASSYRPALCESAMLYNWVFDVFSIQPALDPTRPITEVRVKYSTEADSVQLLPQNSLNTVLPKDGTQEVEMLFELPEFVEAPVQEGTPLGTVTLLIDDKTIGVVELVTAREVQRNTTLFVLGSVREFFSGGFVKSLLVVVAIAALGYVAFIMYTAQKRRKKAHHSHGKTGTIHEIPPEKKARQARQIEDLPEEKTPPKRSIAFYDIPIDEEEEPDEPDERLP